MILRNLTKIIKQNLFKRKIILLYGSRHSGKTTLVKNLLSEFSKNGKYINCELFAMQRGLSVHEPEQIRAFLGQHKLIVLDEVRNIANIDKIFKIIIDSLPETQIIATSSSDFDSSKKIEQSLKGKSINFQLLPLSVQEIINNSEINAVNPKLELLLRFGMYPEIYALPDEETKIERLNETASNYLYKDILEFDKVRFSGNIAKLVQYLALQIGQDVSILDIANEIGINRLTAEKYIDLLEKSFIIFRLKAFSGNKRKEISKSFKIYFYDLGIRNSIIQNFNLTDLRTDTDVMWKNFCIAERKKYLLQNAPDTQTYFYRTFSGQEADYIEEKNGKLTACIFNWTDKRKTRRVHPFTVTYKTEIIKITPKNFMSMFQDLSKDKKIGSNF